MASECQLWEELGIFQGTQRDAPMDVRLGPNRKGWVSRTSFFFFFNSCTKGIYKQIKTGALELYNFFGKLRELLLERDVSVSRGGNRMTAWKTTIRPTRTLSFLMSKTV